MRGKAAKKRFRRRMEVLATRLGLAVVPILPRAVVVGLARSAGRIGYRLSSKLRRIGLSNLDVAYGDALTLRDKENILRQSFTSFALYALDIFWFSRHTASRIQKYVQIDPSLEHLDRTHAQLCITGHLGNWELIGMYFGLQGLHVTSVANPIQNGVVDEVMTRVRESTGQRILPRKGAIRETLKTLREGGKAGFLLDQNTKPEEGGIYIDFFGLPVPVSAAGASLALRTECDLAFCFCIPQPGGSYHAFVSKVVSPPYDVEGDRNERIQQLTQSIGNHIQTQVATYPGAWLWTYKRWKFVGPGQERASYPFYARPI